MSNKTKKKIETSGQVYCSYVKGLVYRLDAPWWCDTGISNLSFRLEDYGTGEPPHMDNYGRLYAQQGYLWDGSSGPTKDIPGIDDSASLCHDLLYEAMRTRRLPMDCRQQVDALYAQMLRDGGFSWWRSSLRYWGLRMFGRSAAKPRNARSIVQQGKKQ
jgi:hypothetical protein